MTAHAIESKPRKAMNPDRLRKFIDSPSVANATRNVPMAIVKRQTQVTSWNGEQCDVRAFEKLAPSAHVILAKDLRSCAIGKGKPVALVPSGLQINDVTVLPKDQQLQDQLTAPLMTKKETFAHAAEIEHRAVPGSVILKEGIMTPQQRRERLHFETDHLHAKRALHRADTNDRRLHQIIKERHSTCDVIGTQQNAPDATKIRGEAYKPDLLSHNATGASGREYQSKNCNANPRLQHHDRLFNETPLDWNQQRAQNLRNQSTAGRSFNIVNGGRVEHFPPTIPEKQHQWQTHPSVSIHPYTR
ncbi:hypothetical protein L917_07333 [Phytophthora nicotianae]|uniref:Uncharacterized protein n=3 Tax=Phytophthora nicotianae TaxID=4792 RepID=W2QCH2_PHYN3|nr:hypothetical protein PPTG_10686 [Phytophthora nicotianae INRA-310]ETI48265.1 hypothetical protein F443_07691 [Phytophthora nicotianae P1569]ETL94777.1 hypothetical protein L917_07333 [Phytophthora nicotianae]ETM48007.1 hypothetical protein L914_07405 [Phytophthora nicotianae]ETN10576.1 hypothetical protein PPTG_10686 [Phytophthora nicotianae INRA-310]